MLFHRLVVLLLVGSTWACSCGTEPSSAQSTSSSSPEAPKRLQFNTDASAYTDALADLDEEIAKTSARAREQTRSWLVLDKLAKLHMRRARLGGSYDDYAAAEQALAEAFARAPEGTGPVLTRAALNFTLHRLDAIEADLALAEAMVIVDDPTRAAVASMRGDVAFERGEYARALEHYQASLALARNPSILAKLAQWRWRMGEFDEAESLYREAEAGTLDDALESRAWIHLQRGLMDLERGRYDDALADYRAGTELLGGWWLLEEHIAEIATLKAMDGFALELYEDIIARTGNAEFLDAKAGLLRRAGDEEGAKAAIAQAAAIYTSTLERFPEASYGHALDHYLDFGPPARALELAEANHALRPGVPAKIRLAEAHLELGDLEQARALVDAALATGWISADLYWVSHLVYAALGEAPRANELRAQAEGLHPTIARDF